MRMRRRKVLMAASAGIAGLCLGVAGAARGASFPTRPIRLVVPFPPGGGTDNVARALAERVSARLGQPMIVENKSGGFGAIAQQEIANSAPDGHTLVMDSMALVVFPHLMKTPLYDPVKDLDPIAQVNTFPFVIVVNPNVPVKSVTDLIEYLRTNSNANVASAGATTQLAAELFRLQAKVKMTFIPYRGGAPTMVSMLAGDTQVYFGDIPTVINHVKSGKLRAIAVTSKERVSVLPDVPTVAESGLPSYEYVSWNGIYARAGTPADILKVLNAEILRAVRTPEVAALLDAVGSPPGRGTVEEFRAFHVSQYEYWRRIIREANMPYIN